MNLEARWRASIILLGITWSFIILKAYQSVLFAIIYYFAMTFFLIIIYANLKMRYHDAQQYKLLLKSVKIPQSKWQT